jgi:putative ABC transport system permease protein
MAGIGGLDMMVEMMMREFMRHKLRTALTALGVTIGIFLVVTVSSISEGVMYYVNDQISITSGLVTVTQADVPRYMMQQSEIDQNLVADVESLSGVQAVAPILMQTVSGVEITGTERGRENILRGVNIAVADGRELNAGSDEIIIGKSYAENNDYSVGDRIKLKEREFEIVGILEESGDTNIDNAVHMDLPVLQDLTDKEGIVSIMMVQPVSVDDADAIENAINDDFPDLSAATDKSIMNSVGDMLGQLNVMTFALGSIAALISGIVIMNVMIISVRERRRQIGTMKAIGATSRQILLTVVLESVTISVSGAVVGVMLGYSGAAFINGILASPIALVTPRLVAEGILFAVGIGVVSGLLPARQAARLNPIEAIRYE